MSASPDPGRVSLGMWALMAGLGETLTPGFEFTRRDRAEHAQSHPLRSIFGALTARSSNHRSNCALAPRQSHVRVPYVAAPVPQGELLQSYGSPLRFIHAPKLAAHPIWERNSRTIRDGVILALNADRTAFT
jgi:hypothetical protein